MSNVFQVAEEEYIRDERDFLTPLPLAERFRRILTPQAAVAPFVFPTNSVPAIDISGIGQTKAIAAAFPSLFAAGWKLVIMRASIGLTPDALFDYFWRAAHDAGMYIMAYHLVYPGYSGTSQASIFLRAVDPMLTAIDGHSAAVRDVEVPGDVAAWRKAITDFGIAVTPKLIIGDYSSVAKWLSCTNNMPVPGFAWNASWSNLVNVASFAPATRTILRQIGVYLKHDWVPRPPGVNEDVDVDYWMGTEQELRKFLGYDDTLPPPPNEDNKMLNQILEMVNKNAEKLELLKRMIDYVSNNTDAIKELVSKEMPPPDDGGGTPPPDDEPDVPTWLMEVTESPRTKAFTNFVWKDNTGKLEELKDGAGKPIMEDYYSKIGTRLLYNIGATVECHQEVTIATGGVRYHQIYNLRGDRGQPLYLLKTHIKKPS